MEKQMESKLMQAIKETKRESEERTREIERKLEETQRVSKEQLEQLEQRVQTLAQERPQERKRGCQIL